MHASLFLVEHTLINSHDRQVGIQGVEGGGVRYRNYRIVQLFPVLSGNHQGRKKKKDE